MGAGVERVAVVGPGAMGCLFSALLAEAGHEVWLIDHRPQRARLIAETGVTVEGTGGTRTVPIRATAEPASAGSFAFVFFAVKAYDTRDAAHQYAALAGPNTAVVTLQNGLGNIEALGEVFPPDRIVAGATSHGATLLGTGHVRHAGEGPTVVAPVGAIRESPVQATAALLRSAGLEVAVADDATSVIWSKVVVNCAINPLTALTRLRNGQLIERDELRELVVAVAAETAEVARRCGANLLYEDAGEEAVAVCGRTAENRSSMLQDVLTGRRTEIDALNGAVAREGEAPINAMLAALVRGLCHSERSGAE
jgi:2-dehydropantoate 2-reductase